MRTIHYSLLLIAVFASCRPHGSPKVMDFTLESLTEKIAYIFHNADFNPVECGNILVKGENTKCFLTNLYPVDIENLFSSFSKENLVKLTNWESKLGSSYIQFKYKGHQDLYVSFAVIPTSESRTQQNNQGDYKRMLVVYVEKT